MNSIVCRADYILGVVWFGANARLRALFNLKESPSVLVVI
jgi:hypothetical protein